MLSILRATDNCLGQTRKTTYILTAAFRSLVEAAKHLSECAKTDDTDEIERYAISLFLTLNNNNKNIDIFSRFTYVTRDLIK